MSTKLRALSMIVEVTATGFSAFAVDYPIFTTGANLEELEQNAREAVIFYFSEEGADRKLPGIRFEADLKPLFAHYPFLDVRKMAGRLGISAKLLHEYAMGRKKATLQQTRSILNGLRALGQELVSIG